MTLCIPQKVEAYRVGAGLWGSHVGAPCGLFLAVPGPCGEKLGIVVSDGLPCGLPADGWEHVSVSLSRVGKARVPNWEEMCWVKNLFWDPEDCVVQFHPPKSEHVNNYRVLHLWRSLKAEFPRPPGWMIGIKALGYLEESSA
jgi:hypothetical protein